MDNTKPNDWFATRLLNLDKDVPLLVEEGITPLTSKLESPDFYKDKGKVREMFQTDAGTFDNDKFMEFYNERAKEYETLSAIDTENMFMDYYVKSENDFTTDFGKVDNRKMSVELIANPLKQTMGVVGHNQWSDPVISKREAAQMNRYFDPKTEKWSKKTLNELGAIGLLNEGNLVYATYDSDGTHVDKMTGDVVGHRKGDWKIDEFGNYYAEKADMSAENLNKESVKLSEILTDDNSPWNKIDIFDSDNLKSDIPRTVVKAAATIFALANPITGPTVGYTIAAINLARVLPQISKAIASFFNEDIEFDKLNKWDNYMRKYGRSTSDYAQERFFSLENVINLAADSFVQLRTQQLIGEIPKRLGMMKGINREAMFKDLNSLVLNSSEEGMANLAANQQLLTSMAQATDTYRKYESVMKSATNVSKAISRAYLVATSTEDVYNSARKYGFDPQTSSVISLATYAGIGALFSNDYFRGMLYNTPDDTLRRELKVMIDTYLKNNAAKMGKELGVAAADEAKKQAYKKWGSNIINFFKDHVAEVKSGRFSILGGAMSEAAEETVEEITADAAIQVGKGWSQLKGLFTGKEYDDNYSFLSTDPLTRYSQAFIGGGLGGTIFKLAGRAKYDRDAYANWKTMLGDNNEISKKFVEIVSQGNANMILKEIDKLERSPLISKTLSAFENNVVAEQESESQNAILFGSLRKSITDLDSFLSNNNLQIDYDRFGSIELMRGIRAAWINSKGLQDSLFQDYLQRVGQISEIHAKMETLKSELVTPDPNNKNNDINTELNNLQQVLEFKKNEVRNLMDGKDPSFIGRLMLQSNPHIMNSILPNDKESISIHKYGRSYDALPKMYKNEVDKIIINRTDSGLDEVNYVAAWNTYLGIASDKSISTKTEALSLLAKTFNPHTLGKQVSNGKNIDRFIDHDISKEDILDADYGLPGVIYQLGKSNFLHQTSDEFGDSLRIAHMLTGDTVAVPDYKIDPSYQGILGRDDSENQFYTEQIAQILDRVGEESVNSFYDKLSALLTDYYNDAIDSTDRGRFYEAQILANRFATVDDIEAMRGMALRAIKNTQGLSTAYELQPLSVESNPNVINTRMVDDLINTITKKSSGKDIDIAKIIEDEISKVETLGNKYLIGQELEAIFDDLDSILGKYREKENGERNDTFGLFTAIIAGADVNYRSDVAGVPFGANNYLNQAFKEKGLAIELLQLDPNVISLILDKTSIFTNAIAKLREVDRKNRASVITQQKAMSLRLMEAKLGLVESLLGTDKFKTAPDLIKKAFDGWSTHRIADYASIENDEQYIEEGIAGRNNLLEFERKLSGVWKIASAEEKIDIMTWLTEDMDNLGGDTNVLLSDKMGSDFNFNHPSQLMYLMSATFGVTDKVTAEYIRYVKNGDPDEIKAPFDTQEEVAVSALKFLLSENQEADVKPWIDFVSSKFRAADQITHVLYNSVKGIASGGTGKSNNVIPIIYNVIRAVNPEKNIIFVANNQDQLDTLGKYIPNGQFKTIAEVISDKDSGNMEQYKDTIFIVDEATNINNDDLKSLDNAGIKHNIKFAYFGDTKQHGTLDNMDYGVFAYSTLQLAESLRSATDYGRYNAGNFEVLMEAEDNGEQLLNTDKLHEFTYYEGPQGRFEGIKFERDLLTPEYIVNFIQARGAEIEGRTLLIYSKNADTMKNAASYPPNVRVEFRDTVEGIQGLEWDYVITDMDFTIDGTDLGQVEGKRRIVAEIKDMYTAFSRHRHGLVSMKPLSFSNWGYLKKDWIARAKDPNNPDDTGNNNDRKDFLPVESGLSPEVIDNFKSFKFSVLEKLQYDGKSVEMPITDGKEVTPEIIAEQQKATAEIVKNESPTPVNKVSVNTSDAQVAVGFKLKTEYEESFIKDLGIELADYKSVRTNLYRALTEDRSKYLDNLPEHLKDGKFLIKVQYNTTDDLYNLGNKGRDDKFLNGVHPWVVYRVNGIDITMGMFQTPAAAEAFGLTPTNAIVSVNNITKDYAATPFEPEYFALDNKVKVTRGMNPIDIQEKLVPDSEYIPVIYKDGKYVGGNEHEEFSTTAAIYFQEKGDQGIVPTAAIQAQEDILSKNYRSFYDLTVGNGLYGSISEYESIKTYLQYNRKTSKYRPKGTPFLKGNLVSFITLYDDAQITNVKVDLKEKATTYLKQVSDLNAFLSKAIAILKDDSLDNDSKKMKVNSLMTEKPQWTVSLLSYGSDVITTEAEFDDALLGLRTGKTLATGRNRAAYNTALNHQFGMLLTRISSFVKNQNGGWSKRAADKTSNAKFINQPEVDLVVGHWNKHKDSLLSAYNDWYPGTETMTENDLLDYMNQVALLDDRMKVTDGYFVNDEGQHLLQSSAFSEYLKDIYVLDESGVDWTYILRNSSNVAHSPLPFASDFKGMLYPKLLKDNKLFVETTSGELSIQENGSFNIDTKVIQLSKLHFYFEDDVKFEKVNPDEVIENKVLENPSVDNKVPQEVKEEIKEVVSELSVTSTITSRDLSDINLDLPLGKKGQRRPGEKMNGKVLKEILQIIDGIEESRTLSNPLLANRLRQDIHSMIMNGTIFNPDNYENTTNNEMDDIQRIYNTLVEYKEINNIC